jgi:hypothetical protein
LNVSPGFNSSICGATHGLNGIYPPLDRVLSGWSLKLAFSLACNETAIHKVETDFFQAPWVQSSVNLQRLG